MGTVSSSLVMKRTLIATSEQGPLIMKEQLRPLFERLAVCRRSVAELKYAVKNAQDAIDMERAAANAKKEAAAVDVVRQAIARLRKCTVEDFEELKTALENTQVEQLLEMGEQADKLSKEAEQAVAQQQQKIDKIKE